jgi:hypothetical protein
VKKHLGDLLKGGDRRSIGRANEVAALVTKNPELFPELILGFWSDDVVVRMCAADAAEKVSRAQPELLQTHKRELIGLLAQTQQAELRWHLSAMVPRLHLSANERKRAADAFEDFLNDRSSIVKTFALQALADLAAKDPSLLAGVVERLRQATRTGKPAMKARSRKLLTALELPLLTTFVAIGSSRQSS